MYLMIGLAACSAPARRVAGLIVEPEYRDGFGDRYYLSTCAMCDTLLGTRGEAIDCVLQQRELRFCSQVCRERWDADPLTARSRLDAVMTADQAPHYPLATSIVSGRPLGKRPLDVVCLNRLFRVCDASERGVLIVELERCMRLLDAACIAAQSPTYPMPEKCPVQGDILQSDTPIDIVIANRMVRVCCVRCMRVVRARPYQYMAMVDYANRESHQQSRLDSPF